MGRWAMAVFGRLRSWWVARRRYRPERRYMRGGQPREARALVRR